MEEVHLCVRILNICISLILRIYYSNVKLCYIQANKINLPHHVLAVSIELFDGPHRRVSVGHVRHGADVCLEAWRVDVIWHWNHNLYIVCNRA
jgi:hypothetical protein